ncbi:MAG: DUF6036 family nucleotidyltransferase [Candidatus Hermodarchaeota archaeon]
MIKNDFRKFVELTINTFNASEIKYVLIGGLAATIFGRPRTTLDVDIIIEHDQGKIQKLQEQLKNNGFIFGENEIQIALQERSHCSIFLKDFPYRIDLKGIYSSLDERSMQNRIKEIILNETVFVEKPEDLIIEKLVYGSQLDLEDVKAIILRQGDKLDLEYVRYFAVKEQVEDELNQILEERG